MKKIFKLSALFILLSFPAFAGVNNIAEQDGSPSVFPWKLKVTNGTLTDNGDGTASLTTGGGGGMSIGGTVTSGTAGSVLFVGSGSTLSQDNANIFWDDTNDRLGIGMASPSAKLDVSFSDNASTAVMLLENISDTSTSRGEFFDFREGSARTAVTTIGHQNTSVFGDGTAQTFIAARVANEPLTFQVGGFSAEKMRITSGGNVGIGATIPGAKLEVDGAASGITSIFKANATTPGDTIELLDSSSAVQAAFDSVGRLRLGFPNNDPWGLGTVAFRALDAGTSSGFGFMAVVGKSSTHKPALTIGATDTAVYLQSTWATSGTVDLILGGINAAGTARQTLLLDSTGGATITAGTSATKPLIVMGAASQAVNLQEWQNSSSGVLAFVSSDGAAYYPSLKDSNNNKIVNFNQKTSAVNFIQISNDVTGAYPTIQGNGSDTNVGLILSSKGAGIISADHTFVQRTVPLTDAATVATDASLGNIFTVTLGGNRTLGTPTNLTQGQKLIYIISQDSTGSRTLAYSPAFRFSTDVPSPTLSTAAGTQDYLGFIYNPRGVSARYLSVDCVAVVKGFSP